MTGGIGGRDPVPGDDQDRDGPAEASADRTPGPGTTPEAGPPPIPLTREATVPPGAAWRACLATIWAGLLRRPVVLLLAFAIFLALPLVGGTPWPGALLQAVVGTCIVLLLSVGLAWLRVRRWYPAGGTWRGGLDANGLRLSFPSSDLALPAHAIRGVRPDRGLLMLSIGPRALQLGVPEGLFTTAELEALIARGEAGPAASPSAPITQGASLTGDLVTADTATPQVPRRETRLTQEQGRSIPKTLSRLELSRPLSVFLLLFALYQAYRAIAFGDTLSILIAVMASISWVGLALAPFLQGRRLYQPGTTIGAGLRDGRLSVRLGDRVVEHQASAVRKVVTGRDGVALRLADGGVLFLPTGLLTDDELTELAAARGSGRRR